MKQVILSSTVTSPASSGQHTALFSGNTAAWGSSGSTSANTWQIKRPCVLSNLTVDFRTAPGAGTSRTFEVYKNGASTGLSVTISGTSTQGSIETKKLQLVAGDYVTMYSTYTGSPAAFTRASWSLLCEYADKKYSIPMGTAAAPSTSARNFVYPFAYNGVSWSASDSSITRIYFSHSGKITEFYIFGLINAPGSGKQFVFSIYKNAAEEASSQITISGTSSKSGSVTGLNISITSGDYITISSIPSGTPASPLNVAGLIEFEPNVDGESIMSSSIQSVSATLPTWYRTIHPGQVGSTSSEINSKTIVPINTSFYVKNFGVICGAPGVGKSRTFTIRANEADLTNTVTVSGASTTGSDTTHVDKFSALDYISAQAVASGSPTSSNCAHYSTMYIPPDPQITIIS